MFADIAKIKIKGGDGGAGAVAFHREKYVAAGGPDGGDGGKGGDVVFVVDDNLATLADFRYKRKYAAQNGEPGRGGRQYGRKGQDLEIRVPRGTVIREVQSGAVMADMSKTERFIAAKGGKGGWGNMHFATPTRQVPRFAKPGVPGEEWEISLELKLIADVGLIGFPSVGKSSLISVVSQAKPKIGDYHFTTLVPNLGVVSMGAGNSFVLASESCALDAVGAEFVRDVQPGEIVVIDAEGIHSMHVKTPMRSRLCLFEFVYFARPDSVIDGINVYQSRVEAGKRLAIDDDVEADMVIGVPDSALAAAMGYAQQSGIPYGDGLAKNRYVGRTFIQPEQGMRELGVRTKLNALTRNVRGKRLILVDDSIVRGTTSARTIRLLREAGAAEVHYRISAPPFAHPCYFGTDIPDEKDLIATGHTVEEINKLVGSDTLGYLSIEHVQQLAIHSKCGFCTGCFTGKYPVAPPTETMDIVYDKPLSQSKTNKKL